MSRQLNISSKSSGEVYTLLYPNNLLNFCKYDFTLFLEHCTDLCRLAARTGEYNVDDVYSIRNSISGCHKYYEQNMRTVFEKIVIDCWIDYLGKQNDVSVGTLWQSFMRCRNDFERAIFNRLSEYRYNRAINEWVNLVRIQEYAQRKTDFIFGVKLNSTQEAAARANYFDLIFNVAANEMGFPIEELSGSGVYSVGRLPASPFVMSTAAREIARNQLQGLEYRDSDYKSRKNPDLTDKTAMDAFSAIKRFIPPKYDTMTGTIIKSMVGNTPKVFVPGSFKAIIDLEIDATIESGTFIQRCASCDDFFIRDSDYDFDYCSKVQPDGRTCLENFRRGRVGPVAPEQNYEAESIVEEEEDDEFKVIYVDKAVVNEKTDALYKEMAARVNVDMTQRDFSIWYQKELRLKEQILLGEAGEKELDEFIELSRGDEFASRKNRPVYESPSDDDEETELTENGKEVKKFVFEKVERPAPKTPDNPDFQTEREALDAIRKLFGENTAARSQNAAVPVQPQVTPQQQAPTVQQMQPQPQNQYAQDYRRAQVQQQSMRVQSYQPQSFVQQAHPLQQKPVSKIIRGSAAGYSEKQFDVPKRPKTVMIPNGTPEQVKLPEPQPTVAPVIHEETDSDIKVFTPKPKLPREENPFTTGQRNNYIEPSPYEQIKRPLEEYKKKEEVAEPEVDGQISAEEIERTEEVAEKKPQKAVLPAGAISAYKSTGSGTPPKAERVDFSHVLDGIHRDDGFDRSTELVDSDGLPVSHKTKHVMDALFAPTRVSPFLRINLDDDDD